MSLGKQSSSKDGYEPYPFQFNTKAFDAPSRPGNEAASATINLPNVRGRIPSIQASRLRSMIKEAHNDPKKIVAHPCVYDALSARLAEEAGFPVVFCAGYAVASSHGLPDTGYIAMQEMSDKIQQISRIVSVPIFADGDTGYGSPMNVKRTVESFAKAGAAGVMIEDQIWPKRCGHTKDKGVVTRGEAYARIQAAVDAREEGLDIVIMARTDALIHGRDEALTRAREFVRIGVDIIFIEAIPDLATMREIIKEVDFPICANMIEGGKSENVSASVLAEAGFAVAGYPITLIAAHLNGLREALKGLKGSLTKGPPPVIMDFPEVCEGVGFNKYWSKEQRYKFDDDGLVNGIPGQNGEH